MTTVRPTRRSSDRRTPPPGGACRPEGGSDRPRDRRDRPSTATASVRAAGRTLDNESRPSLGFIGVIYDPHLAIRFLSRTLAPIIDNPMTNGGGYIRLRGQVISATQRRRYKNGRAHG